MVSKHPDAARGLEPPEGASTARAPGSQSPGLLNWDRMKLCCFGHPILSLLGSTRGTGGGTDGGRISALTHGSTWCPGEAGEELRPSLSSLFQVLQLLGHAENVLGRPWPVHHGPAWADEIPGV